jgi:hypothetical protein
MTTGPPGSADGPIVMLIVDNGCTIMDAVWGP